MGWWGSAKERRGKHPLRWRRWRWTELWRKPSRGQRSIPVRVLQRLPELAHQQSRWRREWRWRRRLCRPSSQTSEWLRSRSDTGLANALGAWPIIRSACYQYPESSTYADAWIVIGRLCLVRSWVATRAPSAASRVSSSNSSCNGRPRFRRQLVVRDAPR